MTYFITPGVGMSLATPSTAQTFETPVVNNNFILLENGILADRVRLTAGEGRTGIVADHDALIAITTPASGWVRVVAEGGAEFEYNGALWIQKTIANFSTIAARDTSYNKAGGVFRVPNAIIQRADAPLWQEQWYTTATARVAGWYPVAGQGPAFYAEANVGQALVVGANTLTATAFSIAPADLGGMVSFSSGALTVPSYEGEYEVEFSCTINATTAQVQVWVDGVQAITNSVSATFGTARGIVRCNANSVITFRLFAVGAGNSTAHGPTTTTQVSVRWRKVRPT